MSEGIPSENVIGADNQQERPEKKKSVDEQYRLRHQRIKDILGTGYDQAKVDAIATVVGFDTIEEEVKKIRSSTNPIQRRKCISAWYKSHSDILDMFGK